VRVPQPGLLQLNREDLLRDVRERLAERYPDYADESEYDATDPAWVILEQAAWLVELLSQQLDMYPYSTVQEFVYMMGGKLNPAIPSLGVMIAQPAEAGNIVLKSHRPAPWRFFTLQNEEMDMVEFAPVEPNVHIRPAKILNISRIEDGELYLLGQAKGPDGIKAMEAWKTTNKRSRIFDGEWIRYDIITSNAEDLLGTIGTAIEALETRNLGWLEFRTEQPSPEKVSVFARVNLSKAFQADTPTGLTNGNDLLGKWGTLDDSVWTPPVRISSDSRIPRRLQGERPMPGLRRGTIIVPSLPENISIDSVLERKSQPLPTNVVEAIWVTLTHMDQKLAPLKPTINRGIDAVDDENEPLWVSDALDKGMWTILSDRSEQEFIHIEVGQFDGIGGSFRVAMVLKGVREEDIPDIRVFGIQKDEGFQRVPLRFRISWRLRMPDPSGGQRMVLVVALDIDLDANHSEILIATECSPICTMVNAIMVANAPSIFDGRELIINRNVPEPINLLFDDIVNKDVISHLLRDNIPSDTARLLSQLSISYLEVTGSAAIEDFDGVWIDPTATAGDGAMIRVNAPDDKGYQRQIRPGKTVTLNWYRRTDGAFGNVQPSSIQVVEQPPRSKPLILSCHNPLGTFYGADRESEQEAIERMFSPSSGVAVMPSDWERLFRVAFGVRGRGWIVRCWGHAERNLMSTRLWPIDETGMAVDRDLIRLNRSINNAGPSTLLVVIGAKDGLIDDGNLDWARGVIRGLVRKQMERMPIISDVIVTKFHPLKLRCTEENSEIPTPNFTIDDMKGQLVDSQGITATLNKGRLLLNAGVVEIEVVENV
jgi:hypothetical protein